MTLITSIVGFARVTGAAGYPLTPVTDAAGVPICDLEGDENPGQADVACDASGASAYIGSDTTSITAGLVLTEDPRATGAEAPLEGFTWQVAVGVNGTQVATMGISGKGTNDKDIVYVKCIGSSEPHHAVNATLALAAGSVVVAPHGSYYLLSFTLPVAALAPCGVLSTTAVQLFFGTSQAKNLDVINKDFFTGSGVNFTVVPPITFGGTIGMTKAATWVSGPNPPFAGQTTIYDLLVTATNPSAYALADVNVNDTAPAGVAIQGLTPSSGTASFSGQNVSWSFAGLVAGASETLRIRVSATPEVGDLGQRMLLNAGAGGTATRTAGGGTVSDISAPVSTAVVDGPAVTTTTTIPVTTTTVSVTTTTVSVTTTTVPVTTTTVPGTTTTTVPVTTTTVPVTTTTVPVTTTTVPVTTTTVPVTTTTVPVTTTTVPVTTAAVPATDAMAASPGILESVALPSIDTTTASRPSVIESIVLNSVLTSPVPSGSVETVLVPAVVTNPAASTAGSRSAPVYASSLARTGSGSLTLASWGLSLVIGGALLVIPGRRRRSPLPVTPGSGSRYG